MTIILAVKETTKTETTIVLAADGQGTGGNFKQIRKDEKVFKKGEFMIGFAGSYRVGQVIRYCFDIPFHVPDLEPMEYMVSVFIPALRACLEENHTGLYDKDIESHSSLILAYRGEIYEIDPDYQVGLPAENYAANGSGVEIAIGALYALNDFKMKPLDKAQKALEAATAHSTYIGAGYTLLEEKYPL